jgi:hypothetical protein
VRGFRGSRAAQNFNHRQSGRSYERKAQKESFLKLVEERAQPQEKPELPTWLKGLEEKPAAPKPAAPKPAAPKPEPVPVRAAPVRPTPARAAPVRAKKAPASRKPAAKAKSPTRKAA